MNAANNYVKDFSKFMVTSVYGKPMENVRKRINVRIINNENNFLKYTSRPTNITCNIFNKSCAAIHKIKLVSILNKPTYFGFNVLNFSK